MNNAMLLYAHLTDKELLDLVKSGQKACFEVLLRRHNNALYRIARMYGFSHNEAEELLQCTHLEAYSRRHHVQGNLSYRTWLTKLMINNCLKSRKEQAQPDETAEPAGAAGRPGYHHDSERLTISSGISGKVESSIEQLPVPLRSVYILSEIDGYSITETAHLLATSEDNIQQRLNRARSSLRKSLRRWHQYTDIYPFDHHGCDRVVGHVMGRIDAAADVPLGAPVF